MQRFYGLDLDQLGYGLRVRRAADLAAHLPEDACIWSEINPLAEWDTTRHLLADIADNTNFIAFSKTKPAQRRGAKWTGRIPRPGEPTPRKGDGTSLPVDEIRDLLDRPRG